MRGLRSRRIYETEKSPSICYSKRAPDSTRPIISAYPAANRYVKVTLTASRSSITMKNPMSACEVNNPFDLLGQSPPPAPALDLHGSTHPHLAPSAAQSHQ